MLEQKLKGSVERLPVQVFISDGVDRNKNTPKYVKDILNSKDHHGRIAAANHSAVYDLRDANSIEILFAPDQWHRDACLYKLLNWKSKEDQLTFRDRSITAERINLRHTEHYVVHDRRSLTIPLYLQRNAHIFNNVQVLRGLQKHFRLTCRRRFARHSSVTRMNKLGWFDYDAV